MILLMLCDITGRMKGRQNTGGIANTPMGVASDGMDRDRTRCGFVVRTRRPVAGSGAGPGRLKFALAQQTTLHGAGKIARHNDAVNVDRVGERHGKRVGNVGEELVGGGHIGHRECSHRQQLQSGPC